MRQSESDIHISVLVPFLMNALSESMDDVEPPACPDDDLTLPRSAVNKMIKEMLPHIRVANNSRELILNCCTEFILLLSSQSNEICEKRQKKTILPEHVMDAMQELGYGHYVPEVKDVLVDFKTQLSTRNKGSKKLDKLGMSEEELFKQQQALFAEARQQHYEQELAQHNAAMEAAAAATTEGSAVTLTTQTSVQADDDDDDYD